MSIGKVGAHYIRCYWACPSRSACGARLRQPLAGVRNSHRPFFLFANIHDLRNDSILLTNHNAPQSCAKPTDGLCTQRAERASRFRFLWCALKAQRAEREGRRAPGYRSGARGTRCPTGACAPPSACLTRCSRNTSITSATLHVFASHPSRYFIAPV